MNREINFRFWDTERKGMYYPTPEEYGFNPNQISLF
jgi:hypothetical protein